MCECDCVFKRAFLSLYNIFEIFSVVFLVSVTYFLPVVPKLVTYCYEPCCYIQHCFAAKGQTSMLKHTLHITKLLLIRVGIKISQKCLWSWETLYYYIMNKTLWSLTGKAKKSSLYQTVYFLFLLYCFWWITTNSPLTFFFIFWPFQALYLLDMLLLFLFLPCGIYTT